MSKRLPICKKSGAKAAGSGWAGLWGNAAGSRWTKSKTLNSKPDHDRPAAKGSGPEQAEDLRKSKKSRRNVSSADMAGSGLPMLWTSNAKPKCKKSETDTGGSKQARLRSDGNESRFVESNATKKGSGRAAPSVAGANSVLAGLWINRIRPNCRRSKAKRVNSGHEKLCNGRGAPKMAELTTGRLNTEPILAVPGGSGIGPSWEKERGDVEDSSLVESGISKAKPMHTVL